MPVIIIDSMQDIMVYGLLMVLIWWMPCLILVGICIGTSAKNANYRMERMNQEAERRHQETVAALQDIAKAIRECNEE